MSKKIFLNLIASLLMVVVAWCFFFYPAYICIKLTSNPVLHAGGIPQFVFSQFEKTSISYNKWANEYLESHKAESFGSDCSPNTEWPVFGSAYYLLTAEEIVKKLENNDDPTSKRIIKTARETSKVAAEVLADPKTGSWSRNLWGDSYRDKENLFYRMLIIMGLSSYEKITDDTTYRQLLKKQSLTVAAELKKADTYLFDNYQYLIADKDTGMIIKDYEFMASSFAIGVARSNGRIDHSCPLTMETVACSWPTPFGLIVLKLLSYGSCKTACLGEVALLFLMTRPIASNQIMVYEGRLPMLVNVVISFYLICGILLLLPEIIQWNKWYKHRKK